MGKPSRRWWRALAVLLFFCVATIASAQPLTLSRLDMDPEPLPVQVVSGELDGKFVPRLDMVLIESRDGPRWWRITANETIPPTGSPQLVVTRPTRGPVEVWLPGEAMPVRRALFGRDADFSHSTRFFVVPLPHGLQKGQAIYVRTVARAIIPMQVSIEPLNDVHRKDLQHVALNSYVLTAMAVVALLAFGLWGGLGERGYAYLGMTLVAEIFYLCSIGGEMRAIPVLDDLGLDPRPNRVFSMIAVLGSIRFVLFFLDLRRTQRGVLPLFNACSIVIGALLLASLFVAPAWIPYIGNIVLLVVIFSAIYVSVVAAIRRQREGYFLLLAWSPTFVTLVLRVGAMNEWWPHLAMLDYAVPAGLAFGGMSLIIGLSSKMRQLRHDRDEANHLATYDSLTGALTRAAIEASLKVAIESAHTSQRPLSVVFFDIDHFKRINDEYGHNIGDQALRIVALRTRNRLRDYDLFGRYGGDEILVVLPETPLREATRVAEYLRAAISGSPLSIGGRLVKASLSLGVAELTPGESAESLLERADAALYASKSAGRDRVSTEAAPHIQEATR